MIPSTPLPVESPPPSPPGSMAIVDQEDANIKTYEKVFKKCMEAAGRIANEKQVDIAIAIFDRFYNDQSTMRQAALQMKSMMEVVSSLIGGRR